MSSRRIAFVTPSFRNDFELAADLCHSMDAHVRGDHEHVLVVPRRDLKLFSVLANERRRLIAAESVLGPRGFWNVPVPTRIRIGPWYEKRIREQWWCRAERRRISGWLAQQIIKLAAADYTQSGVIVFVDSDVLLFRNLDTEHFFDGDRNLLKRTELPNALREHTEWYRTARRLLGIERDDTPRWNYIGNFITWRRDTLLALLDRIEAHNGKPWAQVLASGGNWSEYILYGVWCEEGLGMDRARQVARLPVLSHSIWTESQLIDADGLARDLKPEHKALLLQSTLPISLDRRRALVAQFKAQAGLTDDRS